MDNQPTYLTINSISELHRLLGLEKPYHPLISIIDYSQVTQTSQVTNVKLILNLHAISLKTSCTGKHRYGQGYYDFDEGVLGMTGPGQVLSAEGAERYESTGWWLLFHPDFVQSYPLAKAIQNYGFFSYAVNEALYLSAKEQAILENIFEQITQEYQTSIDTHSQDVMVSQLELLLNYANRYYSRQFITRKAVNQSLLAKFETLLTDYFYTGTLEKNGLPTVQYFADSLNVSAHYLSDMLRKYTNQNAQQHIHNKLIEKAKEVLSTTDLSVTEVAYYFGFEHPQSFNKLFKAKTNVTPLEFRASFN